MTDEEEMFEQGLLKLSEKLMMYARGSAELTDAQERRIRAYLQFRLDNWKPIRQVSSTYDSIVYSLVREAINWSEYRSCKQVVLREPST